MESQNITSKHAIVIPIWKFILLSVATLGIYEFFWFYCSWKWLKEDANIKVSPFWRMIFCHLLAGSLAARIRDFFKEKNIPCHYSPFLIGISYFVLIIATKLPDPYWLVAFFSFLPLIPLVKVINTYWEQKDSTISPKKFNWWQIILVTIGFFWFILTVKGTIFPEILEENSKIQSNINKQLEIEVSALKKELPLKIDDVTTLVNVSSGIGPTFTYEYKLKGEAENLTQEDIENALRDNLMEKYNNELSSFKEAGVTVRWIYTNQVGEIIAQIIGKPDEN